MPKMYMIVEPKGKAVFHSLRESPRKCKSDFIAGWATWKEWYKSGWRCIAVQVLAYPINDKCLIKK